MSKVCGKWSDDFDQELSVFRKKGINRTDEENARFGLLHGWFSVCEGKEKKEHKPMTTTSQWTKIDPAVHTPEWFRGKGVTFLCKGVIQYYTTGTIIFGGIGFSSVPDDAEKFFIHPPLPFPLDEEIEREAQRYIDSASFDATQRRYVSGAFIAGARAFLGRGK